MQAIPENSLFRKYKYYDGLTSTPLHAIPADKLQDYLKFTFLSQITFIFKKLLPMLNIILNKSNVIVEDF